MSDPQTNQELSPEAKTIMGRARRSFLFSIGLLIFGLMAIGVAVVYRTSQGGGANAGSEYVIASLKIPAGAEVVSAVAAAGQITLTYRSGAMTSVRIYDGKSGEMIREVPVVSE